MPTFLAWSARPPEHPECSDAGRFSERDDHGQLIFRGPPRGHREPAQWHSGRFEPPARPPAPAGQILFLSDHPDELDAASTAGWQVVGVTREGEPNSPLPPHHWVGSFAEISPTHG
jgi:enolase-phosphatase E1